MESISEALVISAVGNPKDCNCTIYDRQKGNVLATFKDGFSTRNGLCFVGQDYLLSAFQNSNKLNVWILTRNDEGKSMTVPGMVSCCMATRCGLYCFAGIEKSIYVWETSTGALLAILQYHSQEVTCLRITSDSSYFLSGGKDGQVLVWPLAEVISENDVTDGLRPKFTWGDYAAEITDIHVGSLSFYARAAVSSRDRTCRIYELDSGMLLATIRVDFVINAVTMDASEYFLFLGSMEGDIYRINLFAEKEAEVHYNKSELKCSFTGHTKAITCLSVSLSGKYLLSGSEDYHCILWDSVTFSMIRRMPQKGPITNAFFTLMPPGLINEDNKFFPRFAYKWFRKEYDKKQHALAEVVTTIQDKELSLSMVGSPDEYFDSEILINPPQFHNSIIKRNVSVEGMNIANSQMYSFVLSETASKASYPQK